MLAVDDAGGVCRRHALQRPAGRTHPRSSQEHTATHGRHSRVVSINAARSNPLHKRGFGIRLIKRL